MMKLCILDWSTVSSGDISSDIFSEFGEVNCVPLCKNEDVSQVIADSNIVLCNKVLITHEVMESCRDLKYIGLFATGYNNIDIEAARKHGITVCNAGSYSTYAVAQQTFSYILHYTNRIHEYDSFVKKGGWIGSDTFSKFPIPTGELLGKTLSIIGFGSIGRAVAGIASAFGMRVTVNTRTKPDNCPYELVSLEEAFSQGDFVTVHCPLTPETQGLINARNLSLMKKTAVVINTARGGITDEEALAQALSSGSIAAAYTDVLVNEPMCDSTPLKNAPNCIITPHCAWAPLETRQRLVQIVMDNIRGFLKKKPMNVVGNTA